MLGCLRGCILTSILGSVTLIAGSLKELLFHVQTENDPAKLFNVPIPLLHQFSGFLLFIRV
jgi:hypothetical protein